MSEFNVAWQKPVHLALCEQLIYRVNLDEIPDTAGLYIFFRAFGESQIPLYVGQAKNLRQRINSQLKTNVKLMNGIKRSPAGSRQLVVGVFKPKKGQQPGVSLDRMERALIRHYVEDYELFNTQGTHVPMETLTSDRPPRINKLIPRTLTFQKK